MRSCFCFVFFLSSCFLKAQDLYNGRYSKTINDSVFVAGDLIRLPEIHYSLNSSGRIDPEHDSVIIVLLGFFQRNPGMYAEISAHTDTRGDAAANSDLAVQRSQHLVEHLIAADSTLRHRLVPVGKGEAEPIYTEAFINQYKTDKEQVELYHQVNRRTEIRILAMEDAGGYTHAIPFGHERYTRTIQDTSFAVGDRILAPQIFFCDGRLCPSGRDSLEVVIAFLERNPFLIVELICYSDCRGSDKFNQELSLRRANYMADVIKADSSIISERVRPAGAGESEPLYGCEFINALSQSPEIKEYYHAANRRVEILVTGLLHPAFYDQPAGSISNDPIRGRESAYYSDIVFKADKALLEGDYAGALKYYEEAAKLGPPNDPYPAEQARKIRELLVRP